MTSVISLPLGDEVKVTRKGDDGHSSAIINSALYSAQWKKPTVCNNVEDRSRVSYTYRVLWDRQGKLIREWLIKSKTIPY